MHLSICQIPDLTGRDRRIPRLLFLAQLLDSTRTPGKSPPSPEKGIDQKPLSIPTSSALTVLLFWLLAGNPLTPGSLLMRLVLGSLAQNA